MNPVLLFYIFLGAVILWALLSFVFPKIGGFIKEFVQCVKHLIEEDDNE